MKRAVSYISALVFVFTIGCETGRDLTPPESVTHVNITGLNMRFIRRIDNRRQIAAIVKFVSERQSRWTQPWAGVPVASYYAYFCDGNKILGHFAVGGGFFESDLAGNYFRSRKATKSETDAFLTLIGIQGARFE
jgi:hypothetical protein